MKLQAKLITLALATVWAAGVQAQAFPDKPVKILVGFAPGGSTDLVARVVAQRMTTTLGQPFVVENRIGASGILATDALAKSPADGYTLGACCMTTPPISTDFHLELKPGGARADRKRPGRHTAHHRESNP